MVPRTTIAPHSNTILKDLFKAYCQSLRLTIICRTILYGTPHAAGLISCIWVTRYYYLTNIAYLSSTGIIFWVHQYANPKLYFYKYPLKMLNLCLQKILSYRSSRFGYFSQHPFWVFVDNPELTTSFFPDNPLLFYLYLKGCLRHFQSLLLIYLD